MEVKRINISELTFEKDTTFILNNTCNRISFTLKATKKGYKVDFDQCRYSTKQLFKSIQEIQEYISINLAPETMMVIL